MMRLQHVVLISAAVVMLVSSPAAVAQQADIHLVVVTDVSPSMGHTDPKAEVRIAGQKTLLYSAAMDERVLAGLVHFTHKIEKSSPVEPLIKGEGFESVDQTVASFDPRTVPKTGTDISQGLREARKLLEDAAIKNPGRRLDVILLMSDGDFDHAPEFLNPNLSDANGTPNWRSGGPGSEIWRELEALRKQGIVVHTVPINPGVYGHQGIGTEQQRRDQRIKWKKGEELLLQIARATAGTSFRRIPDQVDFAQIYSSAIRREILDGPEIPDTDGNRLIHPLHKSVVFIGKGLTGVTLASEERVQFPAVGVSDRQDDEIKSLGSEYTFRRLAGVDLAIFRRPDVGSLGELARRGWSGAWKVHVQDGDPESVAVVAFGDLTLTSEPKLSTLYWPGESIALKIAPRAALLQSSRLSPADVSELLKSLVLRAELVDENGISVWDDPIEAAHSNGAFELNLDVPIDVPSQGRFKLVIRSLARFDDALCEIFRVNQPIVIRSGEAVRVKGFRKSDGQLLFGPDAEGVRSIKAKDDLVLRVESADSANIVIRAARVAEDDVPNDLLRLPLPPSQSNPPGRWVDLHFKVLNPVGTSGNRSFPIKVDFINPAVDADGQPQRHSVVTSVPGIRVSDADVIQSAKVLPVSAMPRALFVGEKFDWRFTVRLTNISEEFLAEIPDAVEVLLSNSEEFPRVVKRIWADRFGAPRVVPGKAQSRDVDFNLPLDHKHLSSKGYYVYNLANLAGLAVGPKDGRGIRVRTPPVYLSLASKSGSHQKDRTLWAQESLAGRLKAIAPAKLMHVDSLRLRWLVNDRVLARNVVDGLVRPPEANHAEAEFPPLPSVVGEIVPEVVATVRTPWDNQGRSIHVQFRDEPFRVVKAQPEIIGSVTLHESGAPLVANTPSRLSLSLTLRGGTQAQRQELHQALRSWLAQHPSQWLSVQCEGAPASLLDPKLAPFEDPDPADAQAGAVDFSRSLMFRLPAPGKTEIAFRKPIWLNPDEVLYEVERLASVVEPSSYLIQIHPQGVSDQPLLDTRQDGDHLDVLYVPPGESLQVLAGVRDGEVEGQKDFSAKVILTPGDDVSLNPMANPVSREREWRLQSDPFSVEGAHTELRCEIRNAEDQLICVLGPYQLESSEVRWEFTSVTRPPELLPFNVKYLLNGLEVRARCLTPDRLANIRNRLKFRLELVESAQNISHHVPCNEVWEETRRGEGEFVLRWNRPELVGGPLRLKSGARLQVKVQAFVGEGPGPARVPPLANRMLFSLAFGDSPLSMDLLLSEPSAEATPPPPTRDFVLSNEGWIYVREVWSEAVARSYGFSKEASGIQITVKSAEDVPVESQPWKAGWKRFYLHPGKYSVVMQGDLPQSDLAANRIPGCVVGDRRDITVADQLVPAWGQALLGLLAGAVIMLGPRHLVAWWRPRPSDAIQLSVPSTPQFKACALDSRQIGRQRNWLVRLFRALCIPIRSDIYSIKHTLLAPHEADKAYLEFATRDGNLLWRQIEFPGDSSAESLANVQVHESGHVRASRAPWWTLSTAPTVKGWYVAGPQLRQSKVWIKIVWTEKGRRYSANVQVRFAGKQASSAIPGSPLSSSDEPLEQIHK